MRWKRLIPVLLEAAFIVAAWLVAWLVFDARLWIIIIVIFAAYGLVFIYDLYEHWVAGLERPERKERRAKQGEPHYGLAESIPDALPSSRPAGEAEKAEPAPPQEPPLWARPSVERPVAKPPEGEPGESELPREVIADRERQAREQAERETREREAALRPPEPEPEPRPEPESVPGSVAEAVARAAQVPREARAEREPEPVAQYPSLLAEYAAHPGEGVRTHAVGGWNIWQLERLMAARTTREDERNEERQLLLIYLREFADSDGQLPPEFDALVSETFGDLVRGPAGP